MKLFSRKIRRVNPDHIVVKYNHGLYEERVQTSINFFAEYANALRTALNCVRSGFTQVEVIQYREVIHSHSELLRAANNLGMYATDEEIIEEVNHASRRYNPLNLIRSSNKSGALVWAQL